MSGFLLDVNALLALLDPMQVHHEAAHDWYGRRPQKRLLTCSHVENGVIRVASQPKYPNCLGTSGRVHEAVQTFVRQVSAKRCDQEVTLVDNKVLLRPELLTPSPSLGFVFARIGCGQRSQAGDLRPAHSCCSRGWWFQSAGTYPDLSQS